MRDDVNNHEITTSAEVTTVRGYREWVRKAPNRFTINALTRIRDDDEPYKKE